MRCSSASVMEGSGNRVVTAITGEEKMHMVTAVDTTALSNRVRAKTRDLHP